MMHKLILEDMAGMREFGALIKSAREAQGMTGAELAVKLGRPHPFVVRIETGKNANPPDPVTFSDLSRILGVSPERMLRALGYLPVVDKSDIAQSDAVTRLQPRIDRVPWSDRYYQTVESLLDLLADPRANT